MKKIILALLMGLSLSQLIFLVADESRVKEVVFQGPNNQELSGISKFYLQKHISTIEGSVYDEDKIDRDIKRLYDKGLFSSIDKKIIDVGAGLKKVIFEIVVAPRINYIVFSGLDRLTRKKIVSKIHDAGFEDFPEEMHDYYGKHLTHGEMMKIKGAVLNALSERNYVDASITTEVVDNSDDIALIVNVIEGLPVRVDSFDFKSTHNFSQSFIKTQTKFFTSEKWWIFGGKYNYDHLQDDISQINNFYYDNGYLDVTVDAVIDRRKVNTFWGLGGEEYEVDVNLNVEEGDLYSFGRINVEGNVLFDKKTILETFEIKMGDIFNMYDIHEARERLEELYGNKGLIVQKFNLSSVLTNIDVKTIPDFRTKTVTINIEIKEGSEIKIKDFIIRGNERTRDEVIRREMLGILPNQPFNWSARKEAVRRLKNLNYFEDFAGIDVRLDDNVDATERDMILEVKEKRTGDFNFGIGVSSEGDVFGNFSIGQKNFDITDISGFPTNAFDFFRNRQYVGKGQIFNIQLSPGSRVSQYSIGLYEPWLFGYPYGLDLGSSFSETEFETYTEQRFSNSVALSRRFYMDDQELLTVGMGYRDVALALVELDNKAPNFVLESDVDITLRGPSAFIKYDTRDNYQLTTEGHLSEFKYEVLGGPFGGTDLLKLTQKSSIFFTVGEDRQKRRQVFSIRSRIDWQKPYDRTKVVPIFERYFLGGGSTLRGYKRYAIGPQPNGTSIGGAVRHFGGIEYSVPLMGRNVRGITFLDYGTLHENTTKNIFHGYRFGAGAGVRFTIPGLGFPIAIDLAHPVGPKSHFERKRNLHFQFAAQSSF